MSPKLGPFYSLKRKIETHLFFLKNETQNFNLDCLACRLTQTMFRVILILGLICFYLLVIFFLKMLLCNDDEFCFISLSVDFLLMWRRKSHCHISKSALPRQQKGHFFLRYIIKKSTKRDKIKFINIVRDI
jgi:hypothetical protein